LALERKREIVDIPTNESQLRQLFSRVGAKDPEGWARSQAQEGINQLHRFLFLRQAWSNVVSEGDHAWMESAISRAEAYPDEPYAGVGGALKRLMNAGASRDDLSDLVRGMQAQLLFNLCYLLEDPSLAEPELAEVGWALVETDSEFEPTGRTIGALHESVLETDPTGRAMRPRVAP
jgi:hypothetical protein